MVNILIKKEAFMKKKLFGLVMSVLMIVGCFGGTVNASPSDFDCYTYRGTGYVENNYNNRNLVAKIDTYFYENLRDEQYCGCDTYFYERNSAGVVVNNNSYGWTLARFEKGNRVFAESTKEYRYGNATAYSGAVLDLMGATPHYYGKALF